MPDWLSDAWTDIKAAVKTTWPDVTTIARTTQIERMDWKDLSERLELTAPWCVVQMPPMRQDPGWGAGQIVFRAKPTLHYIGKNSGSDIAATIEAKLVLMTQYLVATGFRFSLVADSLILEMSEENPVNAAMLEQQQPYSSGSVSFDILIGFIANT